MEDIIKVEGVAKGYGKHQVLQNLDIAIKKGECFTLLGPSGCGKTVLIRLIAGHEVPDAGKIIIDETVVADSETGEYIPPERRGLGIVFQDYAVWPHMTVFENIAYPLKMEKRPKEEINELVMKMIEVVGMKGLDKRLPSELSGGQQQRVAIARALVKKPKVLLLDEPLSNLDARLRLQTREEIRRIQQNVGITTIFVTHDQEEAMSISDQILVMKNGVEQQIGAPQEVYDNPKNLFVAQFLGTPQINVFTGEIKNEKIMIGDSYINDAKGIEDQPVYIAIRPEGFALESKDSIKGLNASTEMVQTLGRDISIIARNSYCLKETFKVIISSDETNISGDIKLKVKTNKMFVFKKDSEERIYID